MDCFAGAKFDGKDYAATGPTVPPGLTIAITKSGWRSVDPRVPTRGSDSTARSLLAIG